MKLKQLQRALLKICLVFMVILGLAGGGYYVVYNLYISLEGEISLLNSQVATANAETALLTKQLESASEAIAYYENFVKSSNGNEQNFRRDYAKNLLSNLRDKNSIYDLKLNMDPFSKAAEYEKQTVALFVSKVTVQCSAGTDLDIYNFMKDITLSFPGNVDIKSYEINKIKPIDDAALLAIGEGKLGEGIVGGEIIFEWQGIQNNTDPKKTPNNISPPIAPAPVEAPNG